MSGFKKFLLRGNLIDLAVAVVIGTAFSKVVSALVSDLITPLIAAFGKQPDFSNLSFTLNSSKFAYGNFVNTLLTFVIVAAVIYFLIAGPATRLKARFSKADDPETPMTECPECLSSIPAAASRCMYCTAQVSPTDH